MNMMEEDRYYMQKAIDYAERGRGMTNPNPLVGAVIVKDGRIISCGWHEKAGGDHAEIRAIESAGESLKGATLYVTLEPCSHYGRTPPCADRIIKEGFVRVVVAVEDPNPLVSGRGIKRISQAGIEVNVGVLEEEAKIQNEVFMTYITKKRPFILWKTAMSMDGKIATATGESRWISCPESLARVQKLRSELKGIMVGIGTVLKDDPLLLSREPEGRHPIRIVLDSHLRIAQNAKLIETIKDSPLIIAVNDVQDKEKEKLLVQRGVKIIKCPDETGKVNLPLLMKALAKEEIDSVLLEGGGSLTFSAFRQGLIDKALIYIAPAIIGGESAKTPVEGSGFTPLGKAVSLTRISYQTSGQDIKIEGYPQYQLQNEDY